jgi:hypothetical protein
MVHNGKGIINTNINQGFGIGANSNYGVGGMEASKEVKGMDEPGSVDAGFSFVREKKDNRPTTAMDNFSIVPGYSYMNLNYGLYNAFVVSSKGKTAKERIDELLYNHSYC